MCPLSSSELETFLLLNRLFAGASRRPAGLILEGVSAAGILERISAQNLFGKAEALQAASGSFSAARELDHCGRRGIRVLALTDPDYPAMLREIADPPLVLYVRGALNAADGAALAVVGSRHPGFYGLNQARRFGQGLAAAGLTVLSGLAHGIDQAAHAGALTVAYGRTIAVMGSGLDVIYPSSAKEIYAQIAERGALISEYPLGAPPLAYNFPTRNRIIAGLSLGVLVVEAHLRSGSLITAREALEQGREVFAIPGPVDQLTSRGANKLIREGALLVESPDDILEVLAPVLRGLTGPAQVQSAPAESRKDDHKEETVLSDEKEDGEGRKILEALAGGPLALAEMTASGRLDPAAAAEALTRLELAGRIRRSPGGRFALRAAG